VPLPATVAAGYLVFAATPPTIGVISCLKDIAVLLALPRAAGIAAACLLSSSAVLASVVTSTPPPIDARVIGFSGYAGFNTARVLPPVVDVGTAETGEAVQLAFGDPDAEHILGPVALSLGSNGLWPASGGYAGLNALSGTMSFTFARNMAFAGGYFNYNPSLDGTTLVAAFDESDNLLESVELVFNAGDAALVGGGRFYGFSRTAADIRTLVLSNGNIVVDNLTFGTERVVTVPEPGAAGLVLASLGLLVLTTRRRRR